MPLTNVSRHAKRHAEGEHLTTYALVAGAF